jgi:hypothetical protein
MHFAARNMHCNAPAAVPRPAAPTAGFPVVQTQPFMDAKRLDTAISLARAATKRQNTVGLARLHWGWARFCHIGTLNGLAPPHGYTSIDLSINSSIHLSV